MTILKKESEAPERDPDSMEEEVNGDDLLEKGSYYLTMNLLAYPSLMLGAGLQNTSLLSLLLKNSVVKLTLQHKP